MPARKAPRPALVGVAAQRFHQGPARTPRAGLFPEGYRLKANDEVRPSAMRLPPRSGPATRPLLRMDLQGKRQDRQRETSARKAAPLYLAALNRTASLKVRMARMERLSRTALARLPSKLRNTD